MASPGNPHSYIEVRVEVPRNLSDAVCNFIIENICSGLVLDEEDGSDIVGIKFYLPENARNDYDQKLSTYLSSLISMGESLSTIPPIVEKAVRSVEWEQEYRDSIQAVVVAGDVSVRPPWKEMPGSTRHDIIIEPKMAFGTGSHESTRGCIAAVRKWFRPDMRFLDLGCGSGILCILADKMGAGYIKAVDYDQLAIENCGENFIVNQIGAAHDIVHGSIDSCQNDRAYDFVCANIIKSTILDMLDDLKRLTKPGGYLVLAGLLEQDEMEVSEKLLKLGLDSFEVFEDNEWRTFVVRGV
ncbi:MAG: 50S ribosomal protein L11 methyltransferase [Candidatus Zixiibacteriota bacterium]|nr:MAG: 50S ribosomal protein L11 methyltransferase [candidate division Zixibacteria bacterium]